MCKGSRLAAISEGTVMAKARLRCQWPFDCAPRPTPSKLKALLHAAARAQGALLRRPLARYCSWGRGRAWGLVLGPHDLCCLIR